MSGTTSIRKRCPSAPQPRRTARKLLLAAAAVTLAIAVSVLYIEVQSHARYKVTGKTDPATGYRIEYTVSSRYYKSETAVKAEKSKFTEVYTYGPRPAPSVVQWIDSHILHPLTNAGHNVPDHGSGLTQYTCGGLAPPNYAVDADGYVEVSVPPGIARISAHRHGLVCNCPATSLVLDVPPRGQLAAVCVQCLFVHPKNVPITYIFYGNSNGSLEREAVSREMAAIRGSIRIVKVK